MCGFYDSNLEVSLNGKGNIIIDDYEKEARMQCQCQGKFSKHHLYNQSLIVLNRMITYTKLT